MSKTKIYKIQLPDGSWFTTYAEGIYHFTALVNNKLWQAGITDKTIMPQVIKQNLNKKLTHDLFS